MTRSHTRCENIESVDTVTRPRQRLSATAEHFRCGIRIIPEPPILIMHGNSLCLETAIVLRATCRVPAQRSRCRMRHAKVRGTTVTASVCPSLDQ